MKLSDLTPNPRNPRVLTENKKAMMKKSLESLGDVSGFVFNRRTGRLVAGHQKRALLPQDSLITVVETYDTPNEHGTIAWGFVDVLGEKYKYREIDVDETTEMTMNLASNKHGGEFDLPELTDWLNEIDAANIDMDLVGFTAEELANLMAPLEPEHIEGEDDAPEAMPNDTRVTLGDLFILGEHRLLCGDSTSIDAVEKLMNGEKADMVFTDPPYGVEYQSNWRKNKSKDKFEVLKNDDSKLDFAPILHAVTTEESPWFIWTSHQVYSEWREQFKSYYLNTIIWSKGKMGMGDLSSYGNDYEMALYCSKGKPKLASERKPAVWEVNIDSGADYVHPTQKPVKLAQEAIQNHNGKSVLDLFGGSGSTLIACEKTGRKCFMMELDETYCAVILDRWARFSGKDPVRDDGTKWSDITSQSATKP